MVRVSMTLAACVAALPCLVSAQMQIRQASGAASSTSRTRTRNASATQGAATGVAAIPTPSAFTGSLPASISAIVATITPGTVNPPPTYTLPTYYSSGQSNPSISNAPPLPSNPPVANFPPLDMTPLRSFPGSEAIIGAVSLNGVPNVPQTKGTAGCSEAGNEANLAAAGASGNCWWTCGGCTRDTDVTRCPDKNTWGLSYDDGPSPYTPTLLEFLAKNNLKTTFFVVGSRAISRPDILLYEYMNGHQLSVHTWSHPHLTLLSNEDIILELGWTKEVIRQITGVTPNTMRPPYGDIDDRVRAICKAMNLTPIIWTSTGPNSNYDTNDWQIGAGVVTAAEVVSNFDKIIANAPQLDSGYVVLAHDLYQQSVALATEVILPQALASSPKQNLMPIIQCLKKPLGDSYIETNRNLTNGASAPTATASGKAAVTGTTGGGGAQGTGSSGSGSSAASASFGTSHALAVVGVLLSAVAML